MEGPSRLSGKVNIHELNHNCWNPSVFQSLMFVFSVNGFMLHVMSAGIATTADENAINVSQRANNDTLSLTELSSGIKNQRSHQRKCDKSCANKYIQALGFCFLHALFISLFCSISPINMPSIAAKKMRLFICSCPACCKVNSFFHWRWFCSLIFTDQSLTSAFSVLFSSGNSAQMGGRDR